MKLEAKAQLRHLRVGPRKVRLLVDLIRGMHVSDALTQLELSKKHATRPLIKLVQSAIANAVNNAHMDEKTLIIKTAFVDGGPMLYRWAPRAQGRATPIRKRSSHITIVLEGEADEKKHAKKKEEVKEEKKEQVPESTETNVKASETKKRKKTRSEKKV